MLQRKCHEKKQSVIVQIIIIIIIIIIISLRWSRTTMKMMIREMRGQEFYESANLIKNILKVWLEASATTVLVMARREDENSYLGSLCFV